MELNNSDHNFNLSWYLCNSFYSSDNRYSNFSKKEKDDEREKLDKNKSIPFPSLPVSR